MLCVCTYELGHSSLSFSADVLTNSTFDYRQIQIQEDHILAASSLAWHWFASIESHHKYVCDPVQ